MAFTDRERDIARQIKEQGGSREDFLDVLQQVRSQQTETIETPEVKIEVKEDIEVTEVTPEKTVQEIESEQWLGWFVTETSEALWQRVENLAGIKERFDVKIQNRSQKVKEAFERWDKWDAFVESMKGSFNEIWTAFQLIGQGAWAVTDIVWEGLENSVQLFTPEVVEGGIEWAIKGITDTETVQSIAESYNSFKEKNPEAAWNLEATVNIAELIPWVKAVTKWIKTPDAKWEIKQIKKVEELEKEAIWEVEQFLKPTKIATKDITKRITPELIRRLKSWELKAADREVLQAQAKEQIGLVWEEIGDFIKKWKVKWEVRLDSLIDTLAKADDKLRLDGQVLPGNEAAVNFINKQVDFLAKLEWRYGVNLPANKQVELRRLYDVVFDKTITRDKITKFQDDIQVKLADNLRKELAKNNPELDKLNKDFAFAKWLDTVLEDTIQRTTGQAPVWLITTLQAGQQGWIGAAVWGAVWASVWGVPWAAVWAILWGTAWAKLAKVVWNPKYKLVSAKKKSELADAIVSGNQTKIDKILNSIIIGQNINIEE